MFESLEAFKKYYAIGASVSYLHRESTDSLIVSKVSELVIVSSLQFNTQSNRQYTVYGDLLKNRKCVCVQILLSN